MKFKANKLMVVAHPDDESLFGGGQLFKEDKWLILCVTNGNNEERLTEYAQAMNYAEAEYIIWSYPDVWNGDFNRSKLTKDLQIIIDCHKWNKIVTHNLNGEYGHTQHQALSEILHKIVSNNLYIFRLNKDKLLPFEILYKKINLLQFYKSQYHDFDLYKEYIVYEEINRVK